MERLKGKSVYKGIALGKISVLKKDDYVVKRVKVENSEAEIERVAQAREKAKEQLQKLYDKAVKEVGEASAAIFEVHQMMLDDDDYNESIENIIRTQEVNAEYAVATTGDNFSQMFASMDDDYMKARAADVKDISERLVRNLYGGDGGDMEFDQSVIIVADDLSPSETVQMDNIGSVGDMGYVLENDAGGIGLFRSEFLYIGRNELPSEEEQFQAYKQVAQTMAGKKVIIRTLDIGADKQADYLGLGKEDNPALGYRAIRICLTQPEIFKTQLRALFRAAVYGNISIMYPMITSVEEVLEIKKIVKEVKDELEAEGTPYKSDVEEGIMIETPASVMISDDLAKEVDFFSIGTNDLTQYTLAIDRQNEKLDRFYNPHHKAILRMIQTVVDNAHKEGKWAGICGELGADTELTETFVKMGIDELSVAPSMILKLRKIVRDMP